MSPTTQRYLQHTHKCYPSPRLLSFFSVADKAKQILALVSHSGFTHATSKAPNSFTKLIKDLAYFMPKSAEFDLEKKTDFKSEHECVNGC